MYYFNSYLFSKLPKLLNMLQKEVSEAVYGNDFIYARRIGNQDSIKVYEIIGICNKFQSAHVISSLPSLLPWNWSLVHLTSFRMTILKRSDFILSISNGSTGKTEWPKD